MAFESWDEAMLWHGSLIGYMAGVKSACNDEDKSSLLLRMADTQAKLELMESENARLRELVRYAYECAIHSDHATCDDCRRMNGYCILEQRMRELGVEVDE